MRRILSILGTMAGVAILVAGCGGGGGGEAFVPVSGTVTLDGQPLSGATVVFTPVGTQTGTQSSALTDAQGKYSLIEFDKGPGAVVGKHAVKIHKQKGEAEGAKKIDPGLEGVAADLSAEALGAISQDVVPAKYNTQSELSFEVPAGGTDKADFALSSK